MPIFSPDIFDSVGDAIVTGGVGVSTFVALDDTPSSYAGESLKFVRVNSGETALEFVVGAGGGVTTFVALNDTPASYSGEAGKLVAVNNTPDGLEFISPTFIKDSDTPANFTGASKQFVQVNAGETALVFSDLTFLLDADTPSSYVGEGSKLVAVNSTPDGLEFIDHTFLGNTDTPSSYTGEASKIVQVKSDESGLEFVTPSAGDKVKNVKTSLTTGQVQHMAYNDVPITLVTGVAGKIIQPLSATLIPNYATGFQENSSFDGVFGWDASNSGTTMKWAGIKDLMNLKATGTYTYSNPTGSGIMDFSASGKDFQMWSSGAFNGNWTMDIYLTYVILDA